MRRLTLTPRQGFGEVEMSKKTDIEKNLKDEPNQAAIDKATAELLKATAKGGEGKK